jgi:hypothetical protein
VGTNLTPHQEVLGVGENVLRALNPIHCDEDGKPSEGCFMLRRNDLLDNGPSFGILAASPEQAQIAPLGARRGISWEVFATLIDRPEWGVARLNVGAALHELSGQGPEFVQKDDPDWGQHAPAHAMIRGHQSLTNRGMKELQRHLARLACQNILKIPAAKA